jgi:hypothetical protein
MRYKTAKVRFDQVLQHSPVASRRAGRPLTAWGGNDLAHGNQATLRRLAATTPRLQAKLEIGAVEDSLELEADSVAEQVMRMPAPDPSAASGAPQLSRKCAACEAKEEPLRRMGAGDVAPSAAQDAASAVARGGNALPPALRNYFEPRFGQDFSGVRLHADTSAGIAAEAIGARAYTLGRSIAFAPGAYQPATEAGRRLLAHELAHVVQQGGGAALVRRQESGATTVTVPETTIVATAPASLRSAIGSTDYYVERASDFAFRNPGQVPPDYYFGYGDKYAKRFKTVLRPSLSAAGKAWLDCTLVALQTAIEDRRDANVWAFAELERDSGKFKDFAYSSHSDAYVSCGVCNLSIVDETKIVLTPDLTDLLGAEGLMQIGETFLQCQVDWFYPVGPTEGS